MGSGKTASLAAGVSRHGRTASVLNTSLSGSASRITPRRANLNLSNRKCQNEVESGIKINVSRRTRAKAKARLTAVVMSLLVWASLSFSLS